MGKKKIIAETGAGQHGVATATAAALFNMECTIYMGEEDVKRQALNVFRMELLGAKVEAVTDGSRVLKDAVNAALRSWVANIDDTHYILGSALGPHPFPEIVRDFQSVIGREAKQQYRDLTGQDLPDALVACVGGGSNAIGLFHPFVEDESVAMYGAEAAGLGVDTEHHAATLTKGRPVSFMVPSWMCSKMPMVKFLKPSLSQQVWTILVLVQNILTTTILNVPAMSL